MSEPDPKRGGTGLKQSSSTGPRSERGKRNSARNALKHGLSARTLRSMSASDRSAELARLIKKAFPLALTGEDLIQQATDYQFIVERVRGLKANTLAKVMSNLKAAGTACPSNGNAPQPAEQSSLVGSGLGQEWLMLERYEKRAFASRQLALRRLASLKVGKQ